MNKYEYEYDWDSAYCYPNSSVLINNLNIRDSQKLSIAEREITSVQTSRIEDFPVRGCFDLKHLQAIHRSIFQDIYPWAGQLRTVNIAKGNQFCNCMYLEVGFESVYSKLKNDSFLLSISPEHITEKLAFYLGGVNVIHPFREGNGRAQRAYISSLAKAAGYHVDFTNVTAREMIEASAAAFDCDYHPMAAIFKRITEPISRQEQVEYIRTISEPSSPLPQLYEESLHPVLEPENDEGMDMKP